MVKGTAAHAPNSVALRSSDITISYATLEEAANVLATRLEREAVAAEVLVGICLPRTFDRLVAILATWKAGGAVLALDPAWPVLRLRTLLEDSQASMVVTTSGLAPSLGGEGWVTLVAGQEFSVDRQAWPTLPAAACEMRALAYVVYTSGSTGSPKGVEITHQNLSHLVEWHRSAFAVTPHDRVGHIAGLGFDASFWDVWPALCSGASVVLAEDEEVRTSPVLLQRWLLDHRITIAFVPTVLAEVLVTLPWPADAALRWMLTGGEALQARPPSGLPFTLVNNYGPSECTVVATSGPVTCGQDNRPPDIGRPIAGTQIYLFDDQGATVADGDAGEIVIGGAGVGRGYRNSPELTNLRFLPDTLGPSAGRLYRTGDRGCRLPNGRIAFLGRNDEQEKIRGSRVEPAEIAGALMQHPLVHWSSVVATGAIGGRHLVAYVLLADGDRPTSEELRQFLADRLPMQMVPTAFIEIDTIPMTSNGKLDPDSLPMQASLRALPQAGQRPPATSTEERLAAIIGDLLGKQVGADDNFFLLGGHSLLATQVIMRAREAFGVTISLHSLFEAPTVTDLARRIVDLLVARLNEMTDEEVELWVES